MSFSHWLAAHLTSLSLWFGVICTLGIYSVLYRENRVYRLFEHIYLGLATGIGIVETWNDVLLPKWYDPVFKKGEWAWMFAAIVGLMYYFIYSRKMNWVARLAIGFSLGVVSGQQFQGFTNDVWPQIPNTFNPLLPHAAVKNAAGKVLYDAVTWPEAANNIVFTLVLVCVMSYFFFSFEQKHRAIKGSAALGRWMLMFAFGAIFGSTIMARLALLIDRVNFLMTDFGTGVIGPAGPWAVFLVLCALFAVVVVLSLRSRTEGAGSDAP
jgi:hypothetical protein